MIDSRLEPVVEFHIVNRIHIKRDALLHTTRGAHDHLLALEDRNTKELKALREEYIELGRKNGAG